MKKHIASSLDLFFIELNKYKNYAVSGSFDVNSLRSNIYNVSITKDIKYINLFFSYENFELYFNEIKTYLTENAIESSLLEINNIKDYVIEKVNEEFVNDETYQIPKHKKLKPTIAGNSVNVKSLFSKENRNKDSVKQFLFGNNEKKGFLNKLLVYVLLIVFGFVFLYPFIYMLSYSFMSSSDLVNPNVTFIPKDGQIQNYGQAFKVLNYGKSLFQTIMVSAIPSALSVMCCALAGYGLARYKFVGRKAIFGLIIFTFIIPSCLTMLPTVSLFAKMKITGSILSYALPALLGQGIKSAIFILISYQAFKNIPSTVIEAAEIDGANTFRVFLKIGLPSAKSALLLSLLLSIVWYYNETVLAAVYFGSSISTLPLALQNFKSSFEALYQGTTVSGKSLNEAIYMAGTVLNILPLVILYFFTQKHFTQGMDMAGITGE